MSDQTEILPAVDPEHLAEAYVSCADLFDDTKYDGTIRADLILQEIERTNPSFETHDIIDLFRRLCLTVQLVGDVDANWPDSGLCGARPSLLPFAFFELASSETAFEDSTDGYASTFFARPVLDEAFSALRPN